MRCGTGGDEMLSALEMKGVLRCRVCVCVCCLGIRCRVRAMKIFMKIGG